MNIIILFAKKFCLCNAKKSFGCALLNRLWARFTDYDKYFHCHIYMYEGHDTQMSQYI